MVIGLLAISCMAVWADTYHDHMPRQNVEEKRMNFSAEHPKLYFSSTELQHLRSSKEHGRHKHIYTNLIQSADECVKKPVRQKWVPPVSPDPVYANLYDRFYAMMHDMAVMEHLAFAWIYSEDTRYLKPAIFRTMACCRIWKKEADGQPDGGKAYAVMRLLKGLAISYDLLYDTFSPAERDEIRSTITDIGQSYYEHYFMTAPIQGPNFHTHHAVVEYASFGIAALAVLGEYEPARAWLDAVVTKFRNDLLPNGLSPDGAQVEGATFWASTMQYRLTFMDALKRVTGTDLFVHFPDTMDARYAFASIAAGKNATDSFNQDHESVVLSPSYGQIDYYSPVLIGLARWYRDALCQHLACWDRSVGSMQTTRYMTHNNETLLFSWGGNSYAWYDPTVPSAVPADSDLSFIFPSVNEAYMRISYEPNNIVVGMRQYMAVLHAGGRPVYIDHYKDSSSSATVTDMTLEDNGITASVCCNGNKSEGFTRQELCLDRPGRRLTMTRETAAQHSFWCHGQPKREGNMLYWDNGTALEVTRGQIVALDPKGYHDTKIVGMGKLHLKDPMPMTYPLITVRPADGKLVIVIHTATVSSVP